MIPDNLLDKVHCIDAIDLLRMLPDESVNCVVTDPPYGVGSQVSARRLPAERFDEIEGADTINSEWLCDAYRVLPSDGAMYVFAKWVNVGMWQDAISNIGFDVRNMIVWDKGQHGTGDLQGAYAPRHELILFCCKGNHKLKPPRRADVLCIPKINPIDLIHPYQKPSALLEVLITSSTDKGDIILDPFCGSGSTGLAARNLNRHYILGDIDSKWAAVAEKQLSYPYTVSMFELLD